MKRTFERSARPAGFRQWRMSTISGPQWREWREWRGGSRNADGGGETWSVIASLVETCKLIGVDLQAHLANLTARIATGDPQSQIDLLPCAQAPQQLKALACSTTDGRSCVKTTCSRPMGSSVRLTGSSMTLICLGPAPGPPFRRQAP